MALGTWYLSIIFSIIFGFCTHVLDICSYAVLSARKRAQLVHHRLLTIPDRIKICEARSNQYVEHDCILDSGASVHVVGDKSLLSHLSALRTAGTAGTYKTRDGRDLTVAGVGTISGDKFHLFDVLYVPDLGIRVILVSVQLLAALGYLVMFADGECSVTEQSSGKVVGKGRFNDGDGLYHLEFLEIPADTARDCVRAIP